MRGQQHDVVVFGWSGDRVCLSWTTDVGKRLGWVPADEVRRVDR